jgi:hypothetical protein
MSWTIVILVVVLPALVALAAWAMWLGFAALVVRWHGPQSLEAVRHVAEGFQPREWVLLISRQVQSSTLGRGTAGTLPPADSTKPSVRRGPTTLGGYGPRLWCRPYGRPWRRCS